MKNVFAALAVVSVVFGTASGEARSPWVEARLKLSELSTDDHADRMYKATLWHEAKVLLRERAVFPWEVENVRRSIARSPAFEVRRDHGRPVFVTQLGRHSGCLIGAPIVTDPSCDP